MSQRNFVNRPSRGFTLIELLVSVALGSFLLMGVIKIFDANKRGVYLAQAFSEVQEAGRISKELMARDIRMAYFWGCGLNPDDVFDHLDSGDSNYDPTYDPTNWDGVGGQESVSSLTINGINVVDSSDVLELSGASNASNTKVVSPYMNTSAAALHVNTGNALAKGDILLISDCTGADLFTNTANNTIVSGTINHATGANPVTGAVKNAIKDMSHTYGANAKILSPFFRTYFVGVNADGGNSLYRNNNGVAQELVRNVTQMNITFGEDTSGNGSVDTYSDADDVTDMEDVLSIHVELGAVSHSTIAGGDTMDRDYRFTVNIRNRSL